MRTFTKEQRYQRQIDEDEVKFNDMLGLDNFTVPNDEFSDPFITSCFITDQQIFVVLFYNHTQKHHHFIWNTTTRKLGKVVIKMMDCISANFPQKCFYNEEKNEIYIFYRQG